MKSLFDVFYYLIFTKDEDGIHKTDIDDPLWVKIFILTLIGFMCLMVAIVS